jgi:hypothetical protein
VRTSLTDHNGITDIAYFFICLITNTTYIINWIFSSLIKYVFYFKNLSKGGLLGSVRDSEFVCEHVWVHACLRACVCLRAYVREYARVRACVYVNVCVCAYACACVCVCDI